MHASLRLDSELSELEEALMAAHLVRCGACRSFADDLEKITYSLRTTPLVEPSVQFQLPRRRARIGVAQAGTAAAATITAAIALGGYPGFGSSQGQISASEIRSAHDRMVLKEQLMQELDTTAVRPAKRVPRGVVAAKNATVNPTQSGG